MCVSISIISSIVIRICLSAIVFVIITVYHQSVVAGIVVDVDLSTTLTCQKMCQRYLPCTINKLLLTSVANVMLDAV